MITPPPQEPPEGFVRVNWAARLRSDSRCAASVSTFLHVPESSTPDEIAAAVKADRDTRHPGARLYGWATARSQG